MDIVKIMHRFAKYADNPKLIDSEDIIIKYENYICEEYQDSHEKLVVWIKDDWRGFNFEVGHDDNSYFFEIKNLGLSDAENLQSFFSRSEKAIKKKLGLI